MRLRVESSVKDKKGPRPHEVISCELELAHRVNVLNQKLGRGTERRLGDPHIEVLVLACLKVQSVVAPLHLADLIDDHGAILALHLGILGAVGKQLAKIQHQVAEAMNDTARSDDEDALLVPEGLLPPLCSSILCHRQTGRFSGTGSRLLNLGCHMIFLPRAVRLSLDLILLRLFELVCPCGTSALAHLASSLSISLSLFSLSLCYARWLALLFAVWDCEKQSQLTADKRVDYSHHGGDRGGDLPGSR
mmetsp:Transcript_27342/g.53300  ORF Transcript_27342/g.53300 Transcript_27342/m.53300 type:complete len:248 (+) Transcript_27342:3322-4065(+)